MAATYRALRLSNFITADNLLNTLSVTSIPNKYITSNGSIDSTTIPAHHVLVRVMYASVSPSDCKNALGQMPHTTLPRVIGRDFSGKVVGVHTTTSHMLDKHVYGTGGDSGFLVDGSHQDYVCMHHNAVADIPTNMTPQQAATVGVNFVTAYLGIHGLCQLSKDDVILVTGASGGVGSAVKQLALLVGCKIIAVDRGDVNDNNANITNVAVGKLKNGFADLPDVIHSLPIFDHRQRDAHVIMHDIDDSTLTGRQAVKQSLQTNESTGATVVFDVLGNTITQHLLKCLCTNGTVVNISSKRGQLIEVDMFDMYRHQHKLTGANSLLLTSKQCGSVLRELASGFADGNLQPPAIGKIYSVDEIGQAYEDVWKGLKGKAVLDFTQ